MGVCRASGGLWGRRDLRDRTPDWGLGVKWGVCGAGGGWAVGQEGGLWGKWGAMGWGWVSVEVCGAGGGGAVGVYGAGGWVCGAGGGAVGVLGSP